MLFLNFYANLSLGVLVKFLKSEKNAPNISKIGIHPICIPILRAVLPFSEGSSRNLRLNFYIPKSRKHGIFWLERVNPNYIHSLYLDSTCVVRTPHGLADVALVEKTK